MHLYQDERQRRKTAKAVWRRNKTAAHVRAFAAALTAVSPASYMAVKVAIYYGNLQLVLSQVQIAGIELAFGLGPALLALVMYALAFAKVNDLTILRTAQEIDVSWPHVTYSWSRSSELGLMPGGYQTVSFDLTSPDLHLDWDFTLHATVVTGSITTSYFTGLMMPTTNDCLAGELIHRVLIPDVFAMSLEDAFTEPEVVVPGVIVHPQP